MAALTALTLVSSLQPFGDVLLLKGLINACWRLLAVRAHPFAPVLGWLGLLLGLRAAGSVLGVLQPLTQTDLANRVALGLGEEVLGKAQRVPAERFEEPEFHNALWRANYGVQTSFVQVFTTAVGMVGSAVTLVSLGGLLVAIRWVIPALLLATMVPNLTLTARLDRLLWRLRSWSAPEFRRTWYLNMLFNDRQAAKELRLFGLAPHLLREWGERDVALRRRILRVEDRLHAAGVLGTAVAAAGFGGAYWLLLSAAVGGRITIGGFGSAVAAVQGVGLAFQGVLGGWRAIGESLLYVSDVQAFLDAPDEPEPPAGAPPMPAVPSVIETEGLRFAYPGGGLVLRGIDLRVAPGEKIAVVGENGAGKSTLVKLLLGLYRPTGGGVRVAGRDLWSYARSSRRAAATAVFQQYQRYPLTARENVGVGRVERLRDGGALAVAARLGGAAFLEDLPRGLDTLLQKELEGGVDLSGGQWQRVATARAIFRTLAAAPDDAGAAPGAWLLALDEPTAALDPVAEAEVFARFQEMAGGRTAIMVSHRLGSARLADRILVLEGGRIVEAGSHAELLARGGVYARMFAMQAEWYA
jgi:ABC-type multidrug transport system fused ATPase/permease subunit